MRITTIPNFILLLNLILSPFISFSQTCELLNIGSQENVGPAGGSRCPNITPSKIVDESFNYSVTNLNCYSSVTVSVDLLRRSGTLEGLNDSANRQDVAYVTINGNTTTIWGNQFNGGGAAQNVTQTFSNISTINIEVRIIIRNGNGRDCIEILGLENVLVTGLDNVSPTISCPPDINTQCALTEIPAYNNYSSFISAGGSISDNCAIDQSSFQLISETTNNLTCPETITRVFQIADECGNTSNCSQQIIINDTMKPTLSSMPADVTVDCMAIPDLPTITATDNCDSDVPVSFTEKANTVADGCGMIVREWSATDECGNNTTHTQTITVDDNAAPTWTTAANSLDATIECSNAQAISDAQALFPTATDNCDTDVSNIQKTSGAFVPGAQCSQAGSYTNTWTVTDQCGNVSEVFTQIITIVDTMKPVIEQPSQNVFTISCMDNIPDRETLMYTDNCSNSGIAQFSEDNYSVDYCNGFKIIRRWTAEDDCGNQASEVIQEINVAPCPQPKINSIESDATCKSSIVTINDISTYSSNIQYNLIATNSPSYPNLPTSQTSPEFNLTGATYATFSIIDLETGCESENVEVNFICVLPIKLKSFEVTQNDACHNLKWITSSETNNAYFAIEQSNDGKNFYEIDRIEGKGNSNQELSYRYCNTKYTCGTTYYRLKNVDWDGTINYSTIRSIYNECKNHKIVASPNPFSSDITIEYYANQPGQIEFLVIDAIGRIHYKYSENVVEGKNLFNYNWHNLSNDIYFIRATNNNQIVTIKVVKSH